MKFARVQLYRDMGDDVDDPEYVRVKTAHTDRKGRYKISGISLVKVSSESAGCAIVVSDRPGNVIRTYRSVRPKAGKITRSARWGPTSAQGEHRRRRGPRQLLRPGVRHDR